MIVQESKEGITARIEILGVEVGLTEKSTLKTICLWLIGFTAGSKSLLPSQRHRFNNAVRNLFIQLSEKTKEVWLDLLGKVGG